MSFEIVKIKANKFAISLSLSCFIISLSACKTSEPGLQAQNNRNAGAAKGGYQWDGKNVSSLKPVIGRDGDIATLSMALASCNCAPKRSAKLLSSRALLRGVLPQIFVPSIRESISQDSNLKLLSTLPSMLSDSLKGWLASDDKIATEIRSGISKKLNQSLASFGGTNLGTRTPFRLDLFAPEANTAEFTVARQSSLWNLVAGRREMWEARPPLDGVDHGTQLLETLRMMAEWTYIFGIGSDGKPNGFGGLALDVLNGNSVLAKPIDPSKAPDGSGLFASGNFVISYPNASAVNMATQIKEQWSFKSDDVPLLVQAQVWHAAARSFRNLRFDQSPGAKEILTPKDGALGVGAQKLPLIWLNGMSELLSKKYVDKENLKIRSRAFGENSNASLEELVTLANAAQEWSKATRNLQTSGLDAEMQLKLKDASESMNQVVQLCVQGIISQYTFVGDEKRVFIGRQNQQVEPKIAADVAALFYRLQSDGMQSEVLSQVSLSILSTQASTWRQTIKNSDAVTVISVFNAVNAASSVKDSPSWVGQLKENLLASIAEWEAK
ncbi:MAG: hypothetical protein NT027_11755 [Proteobacteria bacterium]|nr:hypothetical protein [Pseudomonadota bacterium]